MAMLPLLKRMGRADLTLTAHRFRSTFSDWCAKQTNTPSEVREMALAHTVCDKVEAAYRRGDLFEKRRQLMDAWAQHCVRLISLRFCIGRGPFLTSRGVAQGDRGVR
jgi:integrase